jgi:hypothetical protein
MRSTLVALFLGMTLVPAAAQQHPAERPAARPTAHPGSPTRPGPKSIGVFEDWTAATNTEASQTVCYAFTRAQSSTPTMSGRGQVVLTVTDRSGGRDAVAISAGFAYAATAAVAVAIEQTTMEFYTAQRSAFARDGHAAVVAFEKGSKVVARSPAPKGSVTDVFSLRGFSAAYAAMNKACPPKSPP